MPHTARTQLLMDPAELKELRRIAKRRRVSVGSLIRDAVREKYLVDDEERRRQAIDRILAMNIGPLPDWPELKEELDSRYDDVPGCEHRAVRRRRAAPAS
jgi:hypothetical protein